MPGTLIPDHFVHHKPTASDVEISCLVWGLSLSVSLYTSFTASKQSFKAWRRGRRVTVYMMYIWLEWLSSTTMGIISWMFMKSYIEPSLEYFLAIFFLWCFQVHTLMQIIINRISILTVDGNGLRRVKWGVFILLCLINISVVCIWVPASLQINEKYIAINNIWDRIQKALICIIDAFLNWYFIYLVRSQLIANGLTKYERLFWFNLVMSIVSVTLDILIVAMMSLPNKLVYVQFHPLVYLLKLQIEMGMADLIVKIVRATNPEIGSSEPYPRYGGTTAAGRTPTDNPASKIHTWQGRQHRTQVEVGDEADGLEMEMYGQAIKKTVVTEVVTVDRDQPQKEEDQQQGRRHNSRWLKSEPADDAISSSSSTRELKKKWKE